MKVLGRRAVVFIAAVLLLLLSAVTVYAWGKAGGVSQPASPSGKQGDYPVTQGYGFRIFLHKVDEDKSDTFLYTQDKNDIFNMKSNVSKILDESAESTALYLGVESNYKVYNDNNDAKNKWVNVDTISDKEFNTCPSISGYSSPTDRKSTNFDDYLKVFNQLGSQMDSNDGVEEVINWFKKQGVNTEGFVPEHTLVVIEPVAKWSWNGGHFLITYQNARKYDTTQKGCFSFFTFKPNMKGSCSVSGDIYTPSESGTLTDFVNSYLGGIYQMRVLKKDDCKTMVYSSSSGYAVYGFENLINNNKMVRSASNISVVYTGDAGTSDAGKFSVYNGLNKTGEAVEPSTTKYTGDYYADSKWNSISKISNSIGITKDKINSYNIRFYGAYKLKLGEDTSISSIKSALDVKNISVNWNSSPAVGSTFNVGNAYSIGGLSYNNGTVYGSSYPIVESLKASFANSSVSEISSQLAAGANNEAINHLLGTAWKKASKYVDDDTIEKGKKLGVSVEFLCNDSVVQSNVVTMHYKTDDKSVSSENTPISYYSTEFGTITTNADACYIIAVPNSDSKKYTAENTEALKQLINGASCGEVLNKFQQYFAGSTIDVSSPCMGGDTVTVGAKTVGNSLYGYTFYILEVEGDLSVDGTICVNDYELNYVYPDVLASITGVNNYAYIGSNIWTVNTESSNNVQCSVCSNIVGVTYPSVDYNIMVYDKSEGTLVDIDNLMSTTKLILNNPAVSNLPERSILTAGQLIDTRNTGYVTTYAVNLTRSMFGDKRTVSTLSEQELDSDFGTDILGLDYGNVPENTLESNSTRNSFAEVGSAGSDSFKFDADFNLTNNKSRNTFSLLTHNCSGSPVYSHQLKTTANALKAFTVAGLRSSKFNINLNEVCYKYQTEDMAIGENTIEPGVVNIQKPDGVNTYGISFVNNSDNILKFYPEVKMRAYQYSGATVSNVAPVDVITMGEKLREAKSSSLYIATINNGGGTPVTGTIMSETFATGSKAGNKNLPVIYAGGEFTVKADLNCTVNMYGYAVDVINKSVDGADGLKVSNTFTIPYKSIVNDESDIYSAWGNSDSTSKILEDYEKWVSEFTDINNYGVELKMRHSRDGEYSLVASADNITNTVVSEFDKVFPITVRGGMPDKESVGYTSLIEQFAIDYNCSKEKAEEIIESSGLYQSILEAIEDCEDDNNNSQAGADLGNSESWYDEIVKTIVVRRITSTPVKLPSVIASDKVDYSMAGEASTGKDGWNQFKNDNTCKFYVSLFFKNLPSSFSGSEVLYNPMDNTTYEKAINDGTVLLNCEYINNADFIVSDVTTDDMNSY